MRILLTNDDGIYAPGLAALEEELRGLGDVTVVAPATEQSGVGHTITFLRPLVCHEVFAEQRQRGWAVEGSPADCVKLGIFELLPNRPQLVVSGINSGLNAGINVLYSGTVAAAIEAAFFGITSVAVSLEYDDHADYATAARRARMVIEHILQAAGPAAQLYNLNIPLSALAEFRGVRVVPMDVQMSTEQFIRRRDPRGRTYYWASGEQPRPAPGGPVTDLAALAQGYLTLTPLQYDLTSHQLLPLVQQWQLDSTPDQEQS